MGTQLAVLLLALAALAAALRGWRWVMLGCGVAALAVAVVAMVAEGGALRVVVLVGVARAALVALALALRAGLARTLPQGVGRVVGRAPPTAAFGGLVILLYILAAIFAPLIAPYGQAEVVGNSFAAPSAEMLLGGDQLGRDLFSRLIYGARNTVGIAAVTTLLAFVSGVLGGLLAAVWGGWMDQALGRLADILLAIPQLIFALLILSITGPGTVNLILVIAVLYFPLIFRLSRSVAGNIVVMDFIEAARLRGEGTWHLVTREVLPNIYAPLAAEFGLRFCFVFLLISALSFLGLGIQPPVADWGSMVRDTASLISFGQATPLIPAAAIALLTVAVNFVVDWMLALSTGTGAEGRE